MIWYVSTETCFLIFNKHVWPRIAWDEQARAILKTLLSQVYPVAVTASRREVATHVATFVLGEKCPMSCESIGRHPLFSAFGFTRPIDATQFDGVPCPTVWKQQFGFPCFLSPALRETMSFCLSETSVPASARGSVVSLYLAFSVHARFLLFFCLFLGWLMHASHMLSDRICSGP